MDSLLTEQAKGRCAVKKVLAITLTLILGFGANYLIALGLLALGLFVTDLTPIWFAAALVVISAFTVLLNFVRKKLTKYVHGTAVILCAQLPSVLFWAVNLAQYVYVYRTADFRSGFERIGTGIAMVSDAIAAIVPAVIILTAFAAWVLSVNKDKIKKWWNEPL